MGSTSGEDNQEHRTFEEELAALEKVVEELEGGQLPLEGAIQRFESGFRSMKQCYEILQNAQARVEKLCAAAGESVPGSDDRASWEPFRLKGVPQLEEEGLEASSTEEVEDPARGAMDES